MPRPLQAVTLAGIHASCSQFASVGALLIIGSLAVDPLSQQLVQFKVVSVQDETGSANLPTAISLNSAIWEYTNTPDGEWASHQVCSWYTSRTERLTRAFCASWRIVDT